MEEKKLREELKDVVLDAVAGGKKFTEKDYKQAEKNRKEAENRAKNLMNTPYGFPGAN